MNREKILKEFVRETLQEGLEWEHLAGLAAVAAPFVKSWVEGKIAAHAAEIRKDPERRLTADMEEIIRDAAEDPRLDRLHSLSRWSEEYKSLRKELISDLDAQFAQRLTDWRLDLRLTPSDRARGLKTPAHSRFYDVQAQWRDNRNPLNRIRRAISGTRRDK